MVKSKWGTKCLCLSCGARFYDLPVNSTRITLEKQSWQVPAVLRYADQELVPFRAGEHLAWKLVEA